MNDNEILEVAEDEQFEPSIKCYDGSFKDILTAQLEHQELVSTIHDFCFQNGIDHNKFFSKIHQWSSAILDDEVDPNRRLTLAAVQKRLIDWHTKQQNKKDIKIEV